METTSLSHRVRLQRSSQNSPSRRSYNLNDPNLFRSPLAQDSIFSFDPHNYNRASSIEAQPTQHSSEQSSIDWKDQCRVLLIKSMVLNISVQNLIISLGSYLLNFYDIRITIFQLWMGDLIYALGLAFCRGDKESLLVQLADFGFLVCLKLSAFIYFTSQRFSIQYSAYGFLFYSIVIFMSALYRRSNDRHVSMLTILYQFLLTIVALQYLMITLKWEQYPNWSWSQVLIIMWVVLTFLVFIQILLVVSLCETIYNYCLERNQKFQLIGGIWMLIYCIISFNITKRFWTLNLTVNVLSISLFRRWIEFDDQFGISSNFGFVRIHFPLKCICCSQQTINLHSKFYSLYLFGDEVEQESQPYTEEPGASSPKKVALNLKNVTLPFRLIKLSSSYFSKQLKAGREITYMPSSQKTTNLSHHQISSPPPDTGFAFALRSTSQKKDVALVESPTQIGEVKKSEEEQEQITQPKNNLPSEGNLSKDSMGNKCLVCYDNEPNIVFDPCQHGGICQSCLEDLLAKNQTTCHLCRKKIDKIYKTKKNQSGHLEIVAMDSLI